MHRTPETHKIVSGDLPVRLQCSIIHVRSGDSGRLLPSFSRLLSGHEGNSEITHARNIASSKSGGRKLSKVPCGSPSRHPVKSTGILPRVSVGRSSTVRVPISRCAASRVGFVDCLLPVPVMYPSEISVSMYCCLAGRGVTVPARLF